MLEIYDKRPLHGKKPVPTKSRRDVLSEWDKSHHDQRSIKLFVPIG